MIGRNFGHLRLEFVVNALAAEELQHFLIVRIFTAVGRAVMEVGMLDFDNGQSGSGIDGVGGEFFFNHTAFDHSH